MQVVWHRLWRVLLAVLLLGVLLFTLVIHDFQQKENNRVTAQSPFVVEEYLQRLRSITFDTMSPTFESGRVEIPGLGVISWLPGQTPDQFLRLGTFYDSFNLQLFTMQNIIDLSKIDATTLTLADISLVGKQTLRDLVNAIPDLGKWQVFEIPVLQDLLGTVLGDSGPWDEFRLEQVIEQAELGDLTLASIDLGQYGLDAIPGLSETALARLKGWESTVINSIPGLKGVPFASFPTAPSGIGYIALLDLPYGHKEARRLNTITGSNREGFNVPCNKNSCSYIELSGPSGLGAKALHGKQWIKGGKESDAQMVRGGRGVLGAVCGGKEPTGRHPFGRGFKVVLRETSEPEGKVRFELFFRYCNALGCSPYCIGGIPWFTHHEGDIIFVGLTQPSTPPPKIPDPPRRKPPTVSGTPVDPGKNPISSDCLEQILRAVPPEMLSQARESIPIIIAKATRNGISDLSRLAYILALLEKETSFVVNERLSDYINSSITDPVLVRTSQRYLAIMQECPDLSPGGIGGRFCRMSDKFMFPTLGQLTSLYGPRNGRLHTGIDITAPSGTLILAADCGTVTNVQIGWSEGYGDVVEITHPNQFKTRYAYLKPGSIVVTEGMSVARGQRLAGMGIIGNLEQPGLHFEVVPPGASHDNPLNYLQ